MDKIASPNSEDEGKTLLNLLKNEPSEDVVLQAIHWISLYPNHELASEIVAENFSALPRNDTVELAAQYLEKLPIDSIRPIVYAAIKKTKRPKLSK